MAVSKGTRWTIYIIITVGLIGFGWYLSLHKPPHTYTPKDAPYTDSTPDSASDATAGDDEDGSTWTARIHGRVNSTHAMTSEDRQLFSIELVYDEEPAFGGDMEPDIQSPVTLVGSEEMFENKLGRLPRSNDLIIVETEATEPDPVLLSLQNVEFIDAGED